jgi:hypothetical protein
VTNENFFGQKMFLVRHATALKEKKNLEKALKRGQSWQMGKIQET